MAPKTVESPNLTTTTTTRSTIPRPIRRVCFSFAAYAKNVIAHLRTCNVPIEPALTDPEFATIESTFYFTFPPDLRAILHEGLPVGLGFPNWRASSPQQLHILTHLPIFSLSKHVSTHNFWFHSWGPKPNNTDQAVKLAGKFLKDAPFLVPIYRNCYIPATANLAGNPVFYVDGSDVRLLSFDVSGFFQRVDFLVNDGGAWRVPRMLNWANGPAWAATEARRIEFWSEVAEARGDTRRSGGWWGMEWLEEVCWRLREGGWKEEEVREMMMMDGGDRFDPNKRRHRAVAEEGVACHVRGLSMILLRAGWSREDVVDSLGFHVENEKIDEESWVEFHHTKTCLLKA